MKFKFLLLLAFGLSTSLSFAQPCLVSGYNFNGNANDNTGANNGIVNGASLTTDMDGTPNAAYAFDGMDDYILINSDFDYPERTICFWFNAVAIGTTPQVMVSTDHPGMANGGIGFSVYETGGVDKLRFFHGAGFHDENISVGTWYHVAMVRDSLEVKCYLNCSLVGAIPLTTFTSSNGSAGTRVGCDRLTDRFFNGKIDELFFSDCALTTTEICNKYTGIGELNIGKGKLVIYPNPSSIGSILNIYLETNEPQIVEITNALGERIYTTQVNSSATIYLDPALFSRGIYFASVMTNGTRITSHKFVVE